MTLCVLGLEAYDTGSHRSVRQLISTHSRHQWTWLTRPGRGWKWRLRLAAVELLDTAGEILDGPIDAVFATSMLSVADMRALLPPRLRGVPVALYMHENQAAYPYSDHPRAEPRLDVHFALTNLTSVLAADLVIWNSRWNLTSFVEGMSRILRQASAVDLAGWEQKVESRSTVIWPPVELPPAEVLHNRTGAGAGPIRVVWPHRWEHDKGPQELLELAARHSEALDLRWTILGERFPEVPEAMVELERRLESRIDHIGFEPDRKRYWEHLARADWVLSTARHEFFGIAVVEALLAGCLPWLPNRLSYPELVPEAVGGVAGVTGVGGLSPLEPPADPHAARQLIRSHLQPAVAPNAVGRIDDAIEELAGK